MCVQHHVRSSSGGSRQELGTHPGYEQAAASEASEKSSLLRSMVCALTDLFNRPSGCTDRLATDFYTHTQLA